VTYGTLADLVVVVHAAFVIFAVAGGLLALRWLWVAWFHVPAAAWAVLIEFANWECPLTPLEKHLRALAGQGSYDEGFVAHYILPILYPGELTREIQIALGLGVLIVNAAIYWRVVRKWRRRG
jgi:hypothetical protein